MKKLLTWCGASLMALFMVACGGEDSGAPSQPDQGGGAGNPSIVSLQVTPAQGRIPVGLEQPFTAQATMSDGSVKDVTADARLSWGSSDTAIATIDNADRKGLAKGIKAGTVTITASGTAADGKTVSATAQLEVTDAHVSELQVTPSTAIIAAGLEQAFIATAILSDGSALDVTTFTGLSWSSSAPAIATIDNADRKGVAIGVTPGTVTITASGTANGTPFSATAELTVSDAHVTALQVTPATISVPAGLEQQFTATAFLSDGTSQDVTTFAGLSWSSSNTAVATINTVNKKGLATGVTPGTVTITASGTANGTPFSATAELTVSDAHVTALQVTPATISVPAGLEQQFTATAFLSDGTSQNVTTLAGLSWSSSNTAVATINSTNKKGLATGMTVGTTTITASGSVNGTSFSATAQLTVTNATVTELQVTPVTSTIAAGLTQQYLATATMSDGSTKDVSQFTGLNWTTSDQTIATVSGLAGSKGLATGVTPGTVTITASGRANDRDFSATAELIVTDAVVASLAVTPAAASIGRGRTQQFQAMATFTDGHVQDVTNAPALSWTSSNPAIATISSAGAGGNGLATGVTAGAVTITASGNANNQNFAATAQLTVTNAGGVVTWGDAAMGGDSSAVQSQLTDVKTISNTLYAFAALKQDGTVVTWGSSPHGGDSLAEQGQLLNVQTVFSAGMAFAALKQDGTVVTWGDATYGGDSSAVQSQLNYVQTIFNSGSAFAALKQDGTVVTWGHPNHGSDSSAVQNQLKNVQTIFSNSYAFAALKQDGTVVTWGNAPNGGDSSAVQGLLTNIQTIFSTGSAFTALKQDGTVVTWGSAVNGGNSSAVQGQLTNIQTVFSTGSAFAALKQDGTVVTWGSEANGGNSSAVQGQLTNVQTIFDTGRAFAALKLDGTVVTWGDPGRGGDSSAVQNQLNNIQTIFNCPFSFAALKHDGTVVTWGLADDGGDSSAVQSQLNNVKTIVDTDGAFAALKQDGTVVTWGDQLFGGNSSAVQGQLVNVQTAFGDSYAFAALIGSP